MSATLDSIRAELTRYPKPILVEALALTCTLPLMGYILQGVRAATALDAISRGSDLEKRIDAMRPAMKRRLRSLPKQNAKVRRWNLAVRKHKAALSLYHELMQDPAVCAEVRQHLGLASEAAPA